PRLLVDEALRAQVDSLTGEQRTEALQAAQQAQWRNKAISDLYEPGSVFKLITCAAAQVMSLKTLPSATCMSPAASSSSSPARRRWMRGRSRRTASSSARARSVWPAPASA